MYAYSASCNIYNCIIYIHKCVIHTYKSHTHTHTHTRTHAHTHTYTHTHTHMHTHTHTHTRTHTHTQYRSAHLVEVELQVELTDIAEELIQYLHKVVDNLEIAKVGVLKVQTEAEVQTSIVLGGNLEVTELVKQERRGLSSPYVHHH